METVVKKKKSAQVSRLLRADMYRMLSKAFAYPTDESLAEVKDLVELLSKEKAFGPTICEQLERLHFFIEPKDVKTAYSFWFLQGKLPVSEAITLGRLQSNADVSAFYLAFGLKHKSGEVADSLIYELEFMAILLVKWELAENAEQEAICKDAFSLFYKEHLYDFAEKFTEKVDAHLQLPYYKILATILHQFVKDETLKIK